MMFYFFTHDKAPKIYLQHQCFFQQYLRIQYFRLITNLSSNKQFFDIEKIKQRMTSLKYSMQSQSKDDNDDYINNEDRYQNDENKLTKQLMKKLDEYENEQQIGLQQSIPILYDINIFQQLISIEDAKRRLTQDTKPNHRLQLQARFIYTLWKIIDQQTVQIQFLKQIILLFMTQQTSSLAIKLQQIFQNQADSVIQLLAIWEGMLQNREFHNTFTQNMQQSVLSQQDISQNNFNKSQLQKPLKSYKNQGYSTYRNNGRSDNTCSNFQTKSKSQYRSKQGGKQNQQYLNSRHSVSKNLTQRNSNLTRRQNIQEIRNQIYNSQFYEIPTLTVDKQKQLINRLYVVNKYDRYVELKKIQDEQKIQKEMQQCTFQPKIDINKKRPHTSNKIIQKNDNKTIPGFQKVIQRMKIGQQKTKQLKQKLQFRNISVKPQKNQQKNAKLVAPPKFLNRQKKKQEKKTLFTIQFDIGRHKLTCKIHQNQSSDQLARNIQSIYSLKQDSFEEIREIIQQQIQRYYSLLQNRHQNQNQINEYFQQNQKQDKIGTTQKQNSFIFC